MWKPLQYLSQSRPSLGCSRAHEPQNCFILGEPWGAPSTPPHAFWTPLRTRVLAGQDGSGPHLPQLPDTASQSVLFMGGALCLPQ